MEPQPTVIKLYQGDCLDVLATLDAGSVDAIVTDPPYGKGFHDGGLGGIANDKKPFPIFAPFEGRTIHGDAEPDTRVLAELHRVLRPGSALYLFSQWMVEAAWIEAIRDAGFSVRNRLVWVKPFHAAGDLKTTFGPKHESILFAAKGRHELRGKRESDVWIEPIGSTGCFRRGKLHPTEKPASSPCWQWLLSTVDGGRRRSARPVHQALVAPAWPASRPALTSSARRSIRAIFA